MSSETYMYKLDLKTYDNLNIIVLTIGDEGTPLWRQFVRGNRC